MIRDPALGGKFLLERETAHALVDQEIPRHLIGQIPEGLLQVSAMDVRRSEPLAVEVDAALGEFLQADRQRGIEPAHDALDVLLWHLPERSIT